MADEKENTITAQTDSANQGCSVDWSWLEGRKITSATNDLQNMIIKFEDGLTFKIQALTYKGQAFLAFNPYQNPDEG
jgi:hypothetical protein